MKSDEILTKAFNKQFPAFIKSISSSNYGNSSPYISNVKELEVLFKNDENRLFLLKGLKKVIGEVEKKVGSPLTGLLGGSFLDNQKTPKDMDIVIFYDRSNDSPKLTKYTLPDFFKMASAQKIDAQLFPYDHSPLLTLKVCSFYTLIFSSHRKQKNKSAKGMVIIDFND